MGASDIEETERVPGLGAVQKDTRALRTRLRDQLRSYKHVWQAIEGEGKTVESFAPSPSITLFARSFFPFSLPFDACQASH